MKAIAARRPIVLVVDDDDGVHAALRLALEDDYDVISAFSGDAGLSELERRRADVVLLDLLMPGVDGWQVFERLLHIGGGRPKVIFLTGVDSSAAAVAAVKLGAEDWVVKPFDEAALLMQLRALLTVTPTITIHGGELGARAVVATVAAVRCGVPIEYRPPHAVRPAEPEQAGLLDATGAETLSGLTALLGQAPINLTSLSPATAAALHHISRAYAHVAVERLADALGLRPNHLLQVFKRDIGLTVRDYIARVRVEVIKQRLGERDCPPLDDLAEEVGLCHGSHLSRVFARYVRESPGRYRGNMQRERGNVH